jgi:hypothetical protein
MSEKIDTKHNNNQILEQLVKSKYNETTKKYHKLIDIILDVNFLEKCYFHIKSNRVNSKPFVGDITSYNIGLK